jgi:hypothetical protein
LIEKYITIENIKKAISKAPKNYGQLLIIFQFSSLKFQYSVVQHYSTKQSEPKRLSKSSWKLSSSSLFSQNFEPENAETEQERVQETYLQ